MTDTLAGMTPLADETAGSGGMLESEPTPKELAAMQRLVRQARDQGVALTGQVDC